MLSIDEILNQKSAAVRLSDGLVHLKAKSPNSIFRWEGVVGRSGIATAVNNVIRPKVDHLLAVLVLSSSLLQGPGTCDHNSTERIANILTSIPFLAVGAHTIRSTVFFLELPEVFPLPRKRRTPAGKLYGGSLVGVGAASGMFHASKGRWRALARKIDYWTCAVSATCLTRCLFPEMPNVMLGMCVALIPFRPLLVTSLNALAAEVSFQASDLHMRAFDDATDAVLSV